MKKFLLLIFLFVLARDFYGFSKQGSADLIIFNAKIRTPDAETPEAEAVAVSQNKIIAVGKNAEIKKLSTARTKTIDAGGRLILPGFNDAHVHFLNTGLQFFSVDFRVIETSEDLLEKIKTCARYLPKNQWIRGGGLDFENKLQTIPSKESLDAAAPEHPVFIYSADGKKALANSSALRKITNGKTNAQVQTQGFEIDTNNNFTGILTGEALKIARSFLPSVSYEKDRLAIAEAATKYAASYGVTSVQDMHSDNIFDALKTLERAGKLKTRVYDCFYITDRAKYGFTKFIREDSESLVRRGCLKYFNEEDQADAATLYKYISEADRDGWQIMIHAIGSRAVRSTLDIFDRTIKTNGARDRRFRIEHAHNPDPKDVPLFGKLGVIASMQPFLFFGGTFDESEPYRNLLNTKARPAFGSDALMIEINPLSGIYAAAVKNFSGDVSRQSLTVEEAVRAYTQGSAYAEFQENQKGTLTVGKLADMTMLSDDIFTVDVEKIRTAKVLMTIVDGKIVYENFNPA